MSLSPLKGPLNWVFTKKLVSQQRDALLNSNSTLKLNSLCQRSYKRYLQSSSFQWAALKVVPWLEPEIWQSLHEGSDEDFWVHYFNTCARRAFFKKTLFIYQRERNRDSESKVGRRGRSRSPTEQGARCGAQSQDPAIMTWVEGRSLSGWATRYPKTVFNECSAALLCLLDFTSSVSLTQSISLQSHHKPQPPSLLTSPTTEFFHPIDLYLLNQHRALHTKVTLVHLWLKYKSQLPSEWSADVLTLLQEAPPALAFAHISAFTVLLLLTSVIGLAAVSQNCHVPRTTHFSSDVELRRTLF